MAVTMLYIIVFYNTSMLFYNNPILFDNNVIYGTPSFIRPPPTKVTT